MLSYKQSVFALKIQGQPCLFSLNPLCQDHPSSGSLEQGSLVVLFKIMRFGIQSRELLRRSQFRMDFITT